MNRFFAPLLLVFFLIGCEKKTFVNGLCRSCNPYFIRGEYHEPQLYYEYDVIGSASWYGPGFFGKKKANGEIFNINSINAAHPTLPLPTVVRITNLCTHKYIDLVITDRGPYVYGRTIDLSKKAAIAIGGYKKGIIPVRIQSLVRQSDALSKYLKQKYRSKKSWQYIYKKKIAPYIQDFPYGS